MKDFEEIQPLPQIPLEGEEEAAVEQPSKWRAFFKELVDTVLLALVLFLVINGLTARVRVDGPSMEPSFFNDNRVIVSKVSYWWGDIQRGDVIVFPAPPSPDEDYIKRVIGLPGDQVEVRNGRVFVNGQLLDEPYIAAPPVRDMALTNVPEDSLFVMGDNRNVSSDSRAWGPLKVEDVLGKAVFVYWPLERVGIVTHYDLAGGE